jgi:hypothetical protein
MAITRTELKSSFLEQELESEEYQNYQEFQTVGVVLDGKFHFLICEQIKGEYNEKDMIPEVLRSNQPSAVS